MLNRFLVGLVLLAMGAPAFSAEFNTAPVIISKQTPFNVNNTAEESATFAGVAAVENVKNNIFDFVISCETANNITLKCGSTTVFGPWYFGDTAGLERSFQGFRIQCDTNEAFNITKSGSGDVTVSGYYRQE